MTKPLLNKTALVTGASRGLGKGIAIALGQLGAIVYLTGRSLNSTADDLGGTLQQTAQRIYESGGHAIPIQVDHGNDQQVAELFKQISDENNSLDIVVNNAIAIPNELTNPQPFWDKSLAMLDLLNIGLRSNYVTAYYAAPLLIKSQGLLVNISSFGSVCYMHGPAYGIGKAGTDKMTHDMAHEFKPTGVTVVSLYPGLVKTERTLRVCAQEPDKYGAMLNMAESPEFSGKVIAALFADPDRLSKSGQILVAAELAEIYNVKDINDFSPPSHRPFLGTPPVYSAAIVE